MVAVVAPAVTRALIAVLHTFYAVLYQPGWRNHFYFFAGDVVEECFAQR